MGGDVTGVVLAQLLDPLGLAAAWEPVATRSAGSTFDVRRTHWATRAGDVNTTQPSWIALRADGHSGPVVGQCLHLHRDVSGRLWGVFDSAVALPDNSLYISVETSADGPANGPQINVELTGSALVTRTAQTCIAPARYLHGDLRSAEARKGWRLSELERHVIDTAVATVRNRRTSRDRIEVHDDAPAEVVLSRRSRESLHPLETTQLLEWQDDAQQEELRRPAGKLRLR
jgi:hypothetical protein